MNNFSYPLSMVNNLFAAKKIILYLHKHPGASTVLILRFTCNGKQMYNYNIANGWNRKY